MLCYPVLAPVDFNILYFKVRLEVPLVPDRNTQPQRPLWRAYPVSMTPPSLIKLDIVVKDKHVCQPNLIKVSTPRNIRWLQYDTSHKNTLSFGFEIGR